MPCFIRAVTDSIMAFRYFHCSPRSPSRNFSRALTPSELGSGVAQYQYLSSSPTKTSSGLQGEKAIGPIPKLSESAMAVAAKFVKVHPLPSQSGQRGSGGLGIGVWGGWLGFSGFSGL